MNEYTAYLIIVEILQQAEKPLTVQEICSRINDKRGVQGIRAAEDAVNKHLKRLSEHEIFQRNPKNDQGFHTYQLKHKNF